MFYKLKSFVAFFKFLTCLLISRPSAILLKRNQKIPKEGGGRNWNNIVSLPPHSPVEQQGTSRESNSFFSLFKHIFHYFPQKHPGLTRGIIRHIFVISNRKKCLLHYLFNQDFHATSFVSSNELSIINFHLQCTKHIGN